MSNSKVLLYGYPISSATWRVRAAMIYKRVEFEEKTVDIFAGDADYKTNVNPMGFVPAVKFPQNDQTFFESLPIMELLDSLYPESPILPNDPFLNLQYSAKFVNNDHYSVKQTIFSMYPSK